MYKFYDSDEHGNEVPFEGKDFENFLDMCFQYSDYFSFMYDGDFDTSDAAAGNFFVRAFVSSGITEVIQISNFLNNNTNEIIYRCRLGYNVKVLFFRCCEASKKMILDFS